MQLSPTAAFQPWLCRRLGHSPRLFLLLFFSHSNFSIFFATKEEGSGTRLDSISPIAAVYHVCVASLFTLSQTHGNVATCLPLYCLVTDRLKLTYQLVYVGAVTANHVSIITELWQQVSEMHFCLYYSSLRPLTLIYCWLCTYLKTSPRNVFHTSKLHVYKTKWYMCYW